MIGTTVGHYEILEKLPEGGMGVAHKARDVLLNRTAALKLLPADAADSDKRHRFVQGAQSASALNHMHQIGYNLSDVDPAAIGLSLAGGQMFHASFDRHSNIWLAQSKGRL